MTYRTLPKALSLAFVLAAASLGPLLVPGTALAEAPQEGASGDHAAAKSDGADASKPKHAAKPKSKAKKTTASKAHAATKTHAKADKVASKPAKAKRTAARENKPSGKRAKAQPKSDGDSPKPGARAPRASCKGTAVAFDRGGVEADRFPLVDCHGKVMDSAISKVSVLARPWGAPRQASAKASRIDASVVARLDAVAKKFPGKTITLVGGAPASGSGSSAHKAGRAVDLRVDGVDNQKLAELCRTLADSGCGFYPNASFVHIDARASGAGKAYWIDASEPGEPPRYVSSWPVQPPASKQNPPK